jgi:predicted TIM-barrel enzyme
LRNSRASRPAPNVIASGSTAGCASSEQTLRPVERASDEHPQLAAPGTFVVVTCAWSGA